MAILLPPRDCVTKLAASNARMEGLSTQVRSALSNFSGRDLVSGSEVQDVLLDLLNTIHPVRR